jgi:hypothetical protein
MMNVSVGVDAFLIWLIVGFGTGILLFFNGFARFRRHRLIENTPTSLVRSVAMGLVEIKGVVRKINLLTAPFSMIKCAYYRYTVERYERHGKSSHWVTVAKGDSAQEPFFIDDGSGVLPVYPKNAELTLNKDYEFENGFRKELLAQHVEFLNGHGIAIKNFLVTYRIRFREWYLTEGQNIYLLGSAQKVPTELEDWKWGERNPAFFNEWEQLKYKDRDPADDVIIAKGDENECFIISEEPEEVLANNLATQSMIMIFGGAILSIICLVVVLIKTGVVAMF